MNIKNTLLNLVQKLGSSILYGRPVLVSKCWVLRIQSWQTLALAEVMVGLGYSGEECGEAVPSAAVSFPHLLPHRIYFAEEIWLQPLVTAL